ncbi:DNA polymerase subunit gamma-1, mitochondrial [Neocloeon triangulifer]|uniref:DNA polymerase subunit gamma-1, mitochondrial n=1 Tax=Neocloeon triangulifer TaxID=2078957 RepID=UPI00286EB767|nr:DNA polymerase subunit gamma-1, mitochondrial [Neocloeon triangulifer]XP_059479741.1 DNA polymerase subunit gamma-1, mitochondrial [Neocloeon triangulifer]
MISSKFPHNLRPQTYLLLARSYSKTSCVPQPGESTPSARDVNAKSKGIKVSKKRKFNVTKVLDEFKALGESSLEPSLNNELFASINKTHYTERRNEVNIEMLPEPLFKKIFGNDKGVPQSAIKLKLAREHLQKHDLLEKVDPPLPQINFPLPALKGKNIEEHFFRIAEEQSVAYRELLKQLTSSNIPNLPERWSTAAGWTKYALHRPPEPVPFPDEDCLVFDIEECMGAGLGPTMAVALAPGGWYAWVATPLAQVLDGGAIPPPKEHLSPLDLINLETPPDCKVHRSESKPKVVVAHNASFDRARVKEQYWLKPSLTRFVDTMSLHVCVSGISSFQKSQLVSKKATADDEVHFENIPGEEWKEQSSLSNLSDVHKLYCGGKGLDKTARDLFVKGNLSDIAENFQESMKYCALDVKATHEVLQKVWSLFLQRFPHPATFAGMLEMSVAYLPVSNAWKDYVASSNESYEKVEVQIKQNLCSAADEACALLHNEQYKDDPWLWDLDWSTQELKLKKFASKATDLDWDKEDQTDPLAQKFRYLVQLRAYLPSRLPHLPGYPAWYRALCPRINSADWVSEGATLISPSMLVTPKLLRLSWEGYPLHKVKDQGWGFLIPGRPPSYLDSTESPASPEEKIIEVCKRNQALLPITQMEINEEFEMKMSKIGSRKKHSIQPPKWYKGLGLFCPDVAIPGLWFMRLPHPGGTHLKVGNPLSKEFVTRFSEGTLKGEGEPGKVLHLSNTSSYWKNNRERIESQQVVWLDKESLPHCVSRVKSKQFGAILPQLIVAGTLTRRAVESTWLTASNADSQRIGSELRAMVHAPPGYHMVGADVDSQELWLAALLGDASFAGVHGATAFGWRTLQGKKSLGTDLHSATAKAAGASRQHAKIMNYARIYGAGQNFAQLLLKRFCPEMSEEQCRKAAINTLTLTKGKRLFSIPVQAFRILFDKQLLTAEDKSSDKLFSTSLGNKFGFISDAGEILLTKPELDMLRGFEKASGVKWIQSASAKARSVWHGGTESAMFNKLEDIANSPCPATPFLSARLSRALEPKTVGTFNFLTTRVNWVVQSSAVDFLHLMLISMRWLLGDHADFRFVLSFHDEVRYLVQSARRYEAATALHATNLLVRSFCARRVGIHDLPHSVAFFSGVEVDKAMRKDATSECVTPSNPNGMSVTYGIPQGETLDVYQALEKVGSNPFKRLTRRKFSIYEYCGLHEDFTNEYSK